MMKTYNLYEDMLEIMERSAVMLGLDEKDYVVLKYPERELRVAIPVEMDDGSVRVLDG
jgi:glutamate dehydrogenase (NAD(P)+)